MYGNKSNGLKHFCYIDLLHVFRKIKPPEAKNLRNPVVQTIQISET